MFLCVLGFLEPTDTYKRKGNVVMDNPKIFELGFANYSPMEIEYTLSVASM